MMLGDEMIDEASRKMALQLAERGRVAVLTKDRVTESNTEYAQGGIAVVLSDDALAAALAAAI